MKRIVVTTDFSVNSKRAIHFAAQLASQTYTELLFYNVVPMSAFDTTEVEKHRNKLKNFIEGVYRNNNMIPTNYQCVCELGNDVGSQIISYAKEVKADFICLSARGAGIFEKLFGTIPSHLITESPVPVFVIPKNYTVQPITTICYASDMENIDQEITEVVTLATSLQAKVKVLHYDYAVDLKGNKEELSNLALKYETDDIMFHYRKTDPLFPLNTQLRDDVLAMNPALVVLFTKQNRRWFERLFEPTTAADMYFNAKTPLLVYKKNTK